MGGIMNIKKVGKVLLIGINSIVYIAGVIALLTFIPQWFPIMKDSILVVSVLICVGFVVFLMMGFLSKIFHFRF